VIATDSFTFLVKGAEFTTSVLNALLLSLAVHKELIQDRTVD
jgi:hypothetical protein